MDTADMAGPFGPFREKAWDPARQQAIFIQAVYQKTLGRFENNEPAITTRAYGKARSGIDWADDVSRP